MKTLINCNEPKIINSLMYGDCFLLPSDREPIAYMIVNADHHQIMNPKAVRLCDGVVLEFERGQEIIALVQTSPAVFEFRSLRKEMKDDKPPDMQVDARPYRIEMTEKKRGGG